MNITWNEKTRVFRLDAGGMTYAFAVTDEEGFLSHAYFGAEAGDDDLTYLNHTTELPVPSKLARERGSFLDALPQEMPGDGVGDYRSAGISLVKNGLASGIQPLYESHRIIRGKTVLPGLPSTHAEESEAMTLEITARDAVSGVKVLLFYTVFDGLSVVVRSTRIVNEGQSAVQVSRIMSASVDMELPAARLLTLNGTWGRERKKQIQPIGLGIQSVSSLRGVTSHQAHPFLGILDADATQESGEVYGFEFIYSGNFLAQVERNQFDLLRVQMGIHPMRFLEELAPGESFQTPEAVLIYSDHGLGGMSRTSHKLYKKHLMRSPWLHKERPVLINNWEATFFDFDLEKLLSIAKRAKKEGVELLVMDDGWFGKRNDDNSSLGDWYVNEDKLPGGVKRLSDELKAIGMKLGIWVEPEMVCPDSDLYRAHPDWAFSFDGRKPCLMRNQLVLDYTRKEVRDEIFRQISAVLDSADIAYVKWDMNRALADVASQAEGARAGSLFHQFVLGVYEMQERLLTRYPDLLLENCSSGGGRFDPGMLYYSPQIWTSDNTDAIDRLTIQEGTAMLYPLSTMGAHISVSPSQAVGRIVPMATRGHVALAGTFGYELDINKLPEADAALIPGQIALYHKYGDLVREGEYYRIASWQDNHQYDCYAVVSEDRTRALITWVQVLCEANVKSRKIRIPGLDPDRRYRITVADPAVREDDWSGNFLRPSELAGMKGFLDKTLTGRTLANAGILMPNLRGDFRSVLIEVKAE